jgi:hypothetical protein
MNGNRIPTQMETNTYRNERIKMNLDVDMNMRKIPQKCRQNYLAARTGQPEGGWLGQNSWDRTAGTEQSG